MIIEKITAHRDSFHDFRNYEMDEVFLEWYELNKKVMRKTTRKGFEIGFRLFHGSEPLQDGDIIAANDNHIISICVSPCKCIEIHYYGVQELARLCYEIGNRHAPLFFSESDENSLLIPFDVPTLDLLEKMRFQTVVREGLLIKPVISNISAHSH